ncbi:MAG: phosphatase PAP2 family protein [Solirubrobacteraceae bacterium]
MTAHLRQAPAGSGREGAAAAALAALAIVAAALVWWLASEVDGRALAGLDRDGFELDADIRTGWLTGVVKILTNLGSSVVMGPILLVTIAWLLRNHRRVEAAALGLGGLVVFVAVHVLKAGIDRPRPAAPLAHTTLASFPSGHAAYSVCFVAIAFVLAGGMPRPRAFATGVLAVLLVLIVGFTRIYLRAHYVTDVLGGWALGLSCFAGPLAGGIAVSRMRHNARSS